MISVPASPSTASTLPDTWVPPALRSTKRPGFTCSVVTEASRGGSCAKAAMQVMANSAAKLGLVPMAGPCTCRGSRLSTAARCWRVYSTAKHQAPGFVMSKSGLCIACVLATLPTAPLAAHHSYVEFDQQNTIEIEGTLVAA